MTTKTPKLVTKDSLKELLQCGNPEKIMHTVGRALLVLYNNQETDEQFSHCASHKNGMGFTKSDASIGTEHAKCYKRQKWLPNAHVRYWTTEAGISGYPYLCKYSRQLNDAAIAKQSAKILNDLEKL